MPEISNGKGSAMRSPKFGFATRTKPMNPRVFAVSIMAVSVEVPFKKPAEKVHTTILRFTTLGSNASGY